MKKTIIALLIVSNIFSTAKETPYDFQRLKDLHAKNIEKINQQYIQALDKLRTKYTKKGDLEVAMMLDDEIRKYKASGFKLDGKWKVITHNGKSYTRYFSNGEMIDQNKQRRRVEIKGETITIFWEGRRKGWEKLKIDPSDPDSLKGINSEGGKCVYIRN